ncbi:MAG: ABC transporter ATP-binding protein/permease [Saprospiraceae bacterium]|nr:ABC transporter ATP-binding protein/permease [Saprospiraceae bacterium]
MNKLYLLFSVLDRWKWHYLLAGLLLIVSSFVRMLEPKVLQIAVDGVVNFSKSGGKTTTIEADPIAGLFYTILPKIHLENLVTVLFYIGLLFACLASMQALSRFFASILSASSTEKATKQLRDRLFTHIQALPLSQLDKMPTGEMIQRCTGDVDTIRKFVSTQIVELIRLAAIFIGALIMMFLVHIPYTFISIALVIPIVITAYLFFKKEQIVWQKHEDEQDKLTAIIQENLSGIRVVQAFAQEQAEIDRFEKQNLVKRDIGVRQIDLHMKFWPISDWLVNMQIALSLFAGAYFTLHGQISVGEYASFFTYAVMVTWPMRSLGRIVSQLGMASVAMERISQILDTAQEDYGETPQEDPVIKGKIEFRNVSFAYPHQDTKKASQKWALHNLSFIAQAGKKIAIMGSTGAGKSTIIKLLTRFYEPTEGEIYLDDRPLADYHKTFLRKKFGIVHQKPFLFSTSIKENIAYAQYDAEGHLAIQHTDHVSDTDFQQASRDAAVTDFIHKMPKTYDTVVGEKGVTLSGGQKQRVALARTLLSDPDILVLDDATSAVDTETEHNIQDALGKRMQKKTTFIIAHRLTSVQYADKIIVLEKGQKLQEGTHDELLAQTGFYREVYDIQVHV